jgi:hypothetical protein
MYFYIQLSYSYLYSIKYEVKNKNGHNVIKKQLSFDFSKKKVKYLFCYSSEVFA